MNYNLNNHKQENRKKHLGFNTVFNLVVHTVHQKKKLVIAFITMIITALLNLAGPILIGHTVDEFISTGNYRGLIIFSLILLVTYIIALFGGYIQTKLMGNIGQQMLFTLRNMVVEKVQELPYDFFNQNKAGDLISRINNDTDKINQFFSHSLMQYLRVILIIIGSGIFLLTIHFKLGLAVLAPSLIIFIFTKAVSPWVKRKNVENMKSTGNLSAEIQESLNNFKIIKAFNRSDYFRERFQVINKENYIKSLKAGIANNIFLPVYTFFSNIGLLIVLVAGIYFISERQFTVGLLISFIAYAHSFYNPFRQLASLWAGFQSALASWERIKNILGTENNLKQIPVTGIDETAALVSFREVSFEYKSGVEVLHQITFDLEKGKTYAFVGPTGGGKTTIASLISRLYDTTKGMVLLEGKDIRSFSHEERVKKISFILQDPFLFSGTIRENILYGNYNNVSNKQVETILKNAELESLLLRFEGGLDTKIDILGDGISLGQKQLIAFMRAVLRKPELLILDEATANIDTITESLLEEILKKLPESTTKVIIAHRLNTIANADVIYFVDNGKITHAGSINDAVKMLMENKITS
ncbi:MAG: ABC transporter ATP-binding protein/permease [Bacteroidales bacterium]|nr:ABC transporter ATP-binding protein/permease [Bacteroidales bacterium]